jgi:hypothetical protein
MRYHTSPFIALDAVVANMKKRKPSAHRSRVLLDKQEPHNKMFIKSSSHLLQACRSCSTNPTARGRNSPSSYTNAPFLTVNPRALLMFECLLSLL